MKVVPECFLFLVDLWGHAAVFGFPLLEELIEDDGICKHSGKAGATAGTGRASGLYGSYLEDPAEVCVQSNAYAAAVTDGGGEGESIAAKK